MANYLEMSREELVEEERTLQAAYKAFQNMGLKLNMARGKPGPHQMDLAMDLFKTTDYTAADGTDARNYGNLEGLYEARQLFGEVMGVKPENVFVGGNSSLQLMYFLVSIGYTFGFPESPCPWSQVDHPKFLCPVPGYDRHFGVTEAFGIEMIPVAMNDDGPDMDEVERLAASDASVKGIWCVPKYSNPGGVTYSDEVVRRLASMECAAEDFRIFWDNAYCVHHLFDDAAQQDALLDIGVACQEAGTPDRYFKFASTSKITFPGAGIAAFAASPANVAETKRLMGPQTIGHDKLNQLRHVRFLKDAEGIAAHMRAHAAIIRPKFELVARKLSEGLAGTGIGSWSNPRGGYFVSFDALEGTASRTVTLAKEAGVVMTGAGATWPYKRDPHDSNIRIAPTLPPLEELDEAMDVFVCCVKLAAVEKLLEA